MDDFDTTASLVQPSAAPETTSSTNPALSNNNNNTDYYNNRADESGLQVSPTPNGNAAEANNAANSNPTPNTSGGGAAATNSNFCCAIDRLTHTELSNYSERCASGAPLIIAITDAAKTSDGASTYVAYTISFRNVSVKRRYSDFETLRNALNFLNPACIVPPIPEKHSLVSYAKNTKPKDDVVMIEKRKRMLQSFLNRIVEHPVLSSQHLFHRFLEEDRPWIDILNSEHLRKDKLVLSNGKIKHPDPKFSELENDNSYYGHSLSSLEKTHKRIVRKWQELSADFSDLGASFNGFSLEEEQTLSPLLEKIGEAIDGMHRYGSTLATYHEEIFSECLQEYSQYSECVKDLLKYRKHKQLELEDLTEQIISKQNQLIQIESGASSSGGSGVPSSLRRSGSVLNTITQSLGTMLDMTPADTNKRNGIAKIRDMLLQLEVLKEKTATDLLAVSNTIQQELALFQRIRQRDLKHILKVYVRAHLTYYEESRDVWKEAVGYLGGSSDEASTSIPVA